MKFYSTLPLPEAKSASPPLQENSESPPPLPAHFLPPSCRPPPCPSMGLVRAEQVRAAGYAGWPKIPADRADVRVGLSPTTSLVPKFAYVLGSVTTSRAFARKGKLKIFAPAQKNETRAMRELRYISRFLKSSSAVSSPAFSSTSRVRV